MLSAEGQPALKEGENVLNCLWASSQEKLSSRLLKWH